MNANLRAVLDACVLANFGLCDLFLTLAETPPLYQPLWNREILNEVQRTQAGKLGWPEALSNSWREAVESAFPEAMVTVQKSLVAARTLSDCSHSVQTHPSPKWAQTRPRILDMIGQDILNLAAAAVHHRT